MISIGGKVVIVTGAAQGIGKTFSKALAADRASVVLADISDTVFEAAEEIKSEAGADSCIAVKTDVTSEADTKSMSKAAIDRFGRIDTLVNNAALFQGIRRQPFQEITADEWDRIMAVNLRGMFLCSKSVFPQMRVQKHGKIINMSSGTFFSGAPNFLHYVTSKGGIIGFTRALARELGQYGITVNAIAPGFITPESKKEMTPDAEEVRFIVNQRSIRRELKADDLTGTLVYLCSDASDMVTGQTIAVNAGDSMH